MVVQVVVRRWCVFPRLVQLGHQLQPQGQLVRAVVVLQPGPATWGEEGFGQNEGVRGGWGGMGYKGILHNFIRHLKGFTRYLRGHGIRIVASTFVRVSQRTS